MRSQSSGDTVGVAMASANSCFNRRCEANPLATRQRRLASITTVQVSIADAKPILWRRTDRCSVLSLCDRFQSQTRSQSSGDYLICGWILLIVTRFQSQMRSQSSGDPDSMASCCHDGGFNRRCEANPLATSDRHAYIIDCDSSFNRRCEANPLATA